MSYIVAGPTIVNDIHEHNGNTIKKVLGGSVYCVSGLLFWNESVLYLSRVGPDFGDFYGQWMLDNRLSVEGLIFALPRTHYSSLVYDINGSYDEISIYGTNYDDSVYQASRIQASDISKHCTHQTKGIYLEVNENEPFWEDLSLIKAKTDALIMWEIPAESLSSPKSKLETLQRIDLVDSFSMNILEGMKLFGVSTQESVIERIKSLHVPCFLRAGAAGSYWINENEHWFAPSIALGTPVDQTGCGNASTAAALYGFAENFEPQDIPVIANISAAYTILQYGPYPKITDTEREITRNLLQKLRKTGGSNHE